MLVLLLTNCFSNQPETPKDNERIYFSPNPLEHLEPYEDPGSFDPELTIEGIRKNNIDYYSKLTHNIGNNTFGSCGYVGISMILSYYDTFLSDDIILDDDNNDQTEMYDIVGTTDSSLNSVLSPGVLFETGFNGNLVDVTEYGNLNDIFNGLPNVDLLARTRDQLITHYEYFINVPGDPIIISLANMLLNAFVDSIAFFPQSIRNVEFSISKVNQSFNYLFSRLLYIWSYYESSFHIKLQIDFKTNIYYNPETYGEGQHTPAELALNGGIGYSGISHCLNWYLSDYLGLSENDFSIIQYSGESEAVRDFIIQNVSEGFPVIVGVPGHIMVAYEYTSANTIFGHTGWYGAFNPMNAYRNFDTLYSPSTIYTDATVLILDQEFEFPLNYMSPSGMLISQRSLNNFSYE
ncbi:MAG TPA: hypothetical protein PK340_04530 [Bacilli bacterium]|nr:hypothetical protein [Bacilli bacterium]